MEVPPSTHPQWAAVLRGTQAPEIKFLGLRLLLGRLKAKVASDPGSLPLAVMELRQFFADHGHLPSIQNDLQTIFR